MEKKPIVSFRDVTFFYSVNDEKPVIEDISFSIYENDFVSIIGPNGGGKSTLIKLILGLLKPDSGQIEVMGHSPSEMSHLIGYVPQYMNFDFLYPANVLNIVLTGRINKKFIQFFNAEDRELASKAIETVGMKGYEKKSFAELSGGQRQRILIARALATDSQILLFDEPTANLDREAQTDIYKLLKNLNLDHTIFLVSHDIGFVPSISTKVLCTNRKIEVHPINSLSDLKINNLYNCDISFVDHSVNLETHHDNLSDNK